MSKRLRVVVLGMMGRTPFAGVAWQVLHYLEGFRRLGHEVYYVEDTGDWPYDPVQNAVTEDCRYTIDYIGRLTAWCGLAGRWAYRAAAEGGRVFGLSEVQLSELFQGADALVNVTGATVLRDEHLRVPVRIYLETDPFLPQIEIARGRRFTIELLGAHTHHFTFGENVGTAECALPVEGFQYRPTRQPIVVDWWSSPHPSPPPGHRAAPHRFTTIASWRQSGKDIEWNGEIYRWSKHVEFLKFVELPSRTSTRLELALAQVDTETLDFLMSRGWRLADAMGLSMAISPYRDYILGSDGEFTAAKDQYVRPRTGWFSDRSACYLAAGKPVVTQDTGFGSVLPTGRGLFAFRTLDDAVAALDAIATDYEGHGQAAREIATEWFAAEKVVRSLMDRAGL